MMDDALLRIRPAHHPVCAAFDRGRSGQLKYKTELECGA